MNDAVEFQFPPKLKQQLRRVVAEEQHGEVRIEFQAGRVYRWAMTEYCHVPKPLREPQVAESA